MIVLSNRLHWFWLKFSACIILTGEYDSCSQSQLFAFEIDAEVGADSRDCIKEHRVELDEIMLPAL